MTRIKRLLHETLEIVAYVKTQRRLILISSLKEQILKLTRKVLLDSIKSIRKIVTTERTSKLKITMKKSREKVARMFQVF